MQFISESYFNETEPQPTIPLVYDIVDDHESFRDIYGSPLYRFAYAILDVSGTIQRQINNSKALITVSVPVL